MLRSLPDPFPIRGDAYTVAEPLVSAKARQRSIYNGANRISPEEAWDFARSPKMLFYGISDYVRENLVDLITNADVDASRDFMQSAHAFGYGMKMDEQMWRRVVNEWKQRGRLPVLIEALPEGSVFLPNEPFLQVTSLDDGYGEVAAILEAVMLGQVAIASASATMRAHLYEAFLEYAREDAAPDAKPADIEFAARLMVHDFGMRASSNKYESGMLGRTHLLTFPGTDTFNAAFQAWFLSGGKAMGTSVAALAHRTVQSHPTQYEAFRYAVARAIEAASGSDMPPIVSLVSDCYDFNATIPGDFTDLATAYPQVIAVARPDSGDHVADVLKIVHQAKKNGAYKVQPWNGRVAMTTQRFIQGNSMTWQKMRNVMEALKSEGFSPVNCGIFGVGGWLRNQVTRDSLSAAYKLSAMGLDNEAVVKLSHTRAKLSIPGPVKVMRGLDSYSPTVYLQDETTLGVGGRNILQPVYNGELADPFVGLIDEPFDVIRNRAREEWLNFQAPKVGVLSRRITTIQDAVFAKHGRTRTDFTD